MKWLWWCLGVYAALPGSFLVPIALVMMGLAWWRGGVPGLYSEAGKQWTKLLGLAVFFKRPPTA